MYFHNKLIWSHKCEYYLLETWLNVNHITWHATHSCILSETEVVDWAHYNFSINHVNMQGCLEIQKFEFKKSKNLKHIFGSWF
jgi:hypothetical protein